MKTENNVAAQAGDEPIYCPFCGDAKSQLVERVEGTILHPAYLVRCDNCGGQGPCSDRGDHIAIWDQRAQRAARDEVMPDLAAAIKALKCTPPDYRNYAMDAEQRGYHKDGFRDGFKAAISAAAALAAQVSPRATADVERDAARWRYWREKYGAECRMIPGAIWYADTPEKLDIAVDLCMPAIATTKPGA